MLLLPLVASQRSLSISVGTTQTQYTTGALIHIYGKVLDDNRSPVEGASVSVQVSDAQDTPAHVSLVYTDQSGNYSDSFALSPYAPLGKYTVFASVSKAGLNNSQTQTQFTVVAQITASTEQTSSATSQQQPSSKCLIATASFGSEIAPEVVMLREFRDSRVLQTQVGREFMIAFNTFYYSFSPATAEFISSHPNVRSLMKMALYPLIIILSGAIQLDSVLAPYTETTLIVSGLLAAFGIGFVYFGIPLTLLTLCKKGLVFKHRTTMLWPAFICLISICNLATGELLKSPTLLLVSSVTSVLGFLVLGSFSLATFVMRIVRR